MAEVENLGERMPHVTVVCSDGMHVIPVSLLRDVVAGRVDAGILTEPVLCRIVEEWAELVGAR